MVHKCHTGAPLHKSLGTQPLFGLRPHTSGHSELRKGKPGRGEEKVLCTKESTLLTLLCHRHSRHKTANKNSHSTPTAKGAGTEYPTSKRKGQMLLTLFIPRDSCVQGGRNSICWTHPISTSSSEAVNRDYKYSPLQSSSSWCFPDVLDYNSHKLATLVGGDESCSPTDRGFWVLGSMHTLSGILLNVSVHWCCLWVDGL